MLKRCIFAVTMFCGVNGDVNLEPAPCYDKLSPIVGWDRYSSDSATCISEWKRWWSYIMLKSKVLMSWVDGLKIFIHPKNEESRAIYVRGIYNPNIIYCSKLFLNRDSTIIDIGAGAGYYSLLLSRSVSKCIAIEPSSREFSRLVENVSINNLNNISSYRFAVSNDHTSVKLSIATDERCSLNSIYDAFSVSGIDKISVETVDAIPLDKFVKDNKLERVDFIKFDIEGSELTAIKSSVDTLAKFRPVLLIKINKTALKNSNSSSNDIKYILSQMRYKFYLLNDKTDIVLEEISDLSNITDGYVFAVHETVVPPLFKYENNVSTMEKIFSFFK